MNSILSRNLLDFIDMLDVFIKEEIIPHLDIKLSITYKCLVVKS